MAGLEAAHLAFSASQFLICGSRATFYLRCAPAEPTLCQALYEASGVAGWPSHGTRHAGDCSVEEMDTWVTPHQGTKGSPAGRSPGSREGAVEGHSQQQRAVT